MRSNEFFSSFALEYKPSINLSINSIKLTSTCFIKTIKNGFFIVDENTGKINYDMADDKELLNVISQLDYIRGIYISNICKGINKAILDVNILPSKLIEEESPEIEDIKEKIEEEIKAEVLKEGKDDEATKQIEKEQEEKEIKQAIEETIEQQKEEAKKEIEEAKSA
jgi:hypothetical protein